MNMSMFAVIISLMTKADSEVEPAFMLDEGNTAVARSSSLNKLLLFISTLLSGVVDGAGLTDYRDLDLTGICHLVLDLLRDLS